MSQAMYLNLRDYIDRSPSLSRKAVAMDAGLSESTLSRMLSGKRRITVDEYERLCRAMRVEPARFYRACEGSGFDDSVV